MARQQSPVERGGHCGPRRVDPRGVRGGHRRLGRWPNPAPVDVHGSAIPATAVLPDRPAPVERTRSVRHLRATSIWMRAVSAGSGLAGDLLQRLCLRRPTFYVSVLTYCTTTTTCPSERSVTGTRWSSRPTEDRDGRHLAGDLLREMGRQASGLVHRAGERSPCGRRSEVVEAALRAHPRFCPGSGGPVTH